MLCIVRPVQPQPNLPIDKCLLFCPNTPSQTSPARQEYSSEGLHILEDELEDWLDNEEADVRAEREQLAQIDVNPASASIGLEARESEFMRLTEPDVRRVLRQQSPAAQSSISHGPGRLDITQKAIHNRVLRWARGVDRPVLGRVQQAPLRLLLLGTAGTGKSDTVKCIVSSLNEAWDEEATIRCAHTGIAAFNMGGGT